ncbi:hypothetical protein OG801_26840 [Nocardioides sp. NBC_00163]|uniref:hypothetical protein n=1 Tax=Nocardioides sp. NBC_00163 TaxID=2975999 RepID=UPI0032537179
MLLLGVVLALGSAIAHAAWNTASKTIAPAGRPALWAVAIVESCLVVTVTAVVMIVRGHGIAVSWELLLLSLGSTAMHALTMGLVQVAYQDFDVSQIYPLSRGLAPVVVALTGMVVLGQWLSWAQWVGVLLMAAAVGALLFETVRTRGSLQAKPLLWSACIAVSIAGYTTYDGWVVVERGLDPIAYYAVGTVIQVVLWSVIVHGKYAEGLRQARIHARTVAVLAVLIPTSYVLSLYATLHAPVSLVAAVRSSSLIWVALAAALVLREPIGRVRIAATVLAAAAVVAMVV